MEFKFLWLSHVFLLLVCLNQGKRNSPSKKSGSFSLQVPQQISLCLIGLNEYWRSSHSPTPSVTYYYS